MTESNRQGRYFEKELRLETEFPTEGETPEIWIAVVENEELETLAESGALVLSASSESDAMRAACRPNVLFTLPSRAMGRRALERAPKAATRATAEAWHPSLVKYAARDLNSRYREAFDEPMNSLAWAGWAAARILGEAWTRGAGPDAASVTLYLREKLSFDGQKGVAMSFAPNGQLEQVMFLVKDGRVVGEVPRGQNAQTEIRNLVSPGCEKTP